MTVPAKPIQRKQAFDSIVAVAAASKPTFKDGQESYIGLRAVFFENIKEREVSAGGTANWFVSAKQELNILADRRLGIVSRYETPTDGSVPVYLRDAREQADLKPHYNESDFENWAIMGLTAFQAAYQMVSNAQEPLPGKQKKGAILAKIKDDAKNFLEGIKGSKNPQQFANQTVKQVIAPVVAQSCGYKTNDKAEKALNGVKDFVNMDEPPCALVTLSRAIVEYGNSKDFAQVDVPIYQLTEAQQLDYIKVLLQEDKKDQIPTQFSDLLIKATEDLNANGLPKWYLAIKDSQKKLMVQEYAPKILAGRQIPTQMLDILPGMRNSGEERIYELGAPQKNERGGDVSYATPPKQKLQTYHAGSMGQDTKASFEENVRLTMENMRQFQQLTGAKKIRVNSLISPWFASPNERRLYNIQTEAAKRLNADSKTGFKVSYANTPLEFTRAFLTSDRTIENEVYEDAKEKLVAYTGKSDKDVDLLITKAMKDYPDGLPMNKAKELLVAGKIDTGLRDKIVASLGDAQLILIHNENNNPTINQILQASSFPKNANVATIKAAYKIFNGTDLTELPVHLVSDTAATLFQHMVELRRLQNPTFGDRFTFGLQRNAQRMVKTKQMQSLINELEGEQPSSALISSCKSGKDREGLQAMLTMMDVVGHSLTGISTQLSKIGNTIGSSLYNVAASVVNAAHITTRAGLQGGSEGAKGIKNEGRVLPIWLTSLFDNIAKPEASSNKKIKKDKNISKEDAKAVKEQVQNMSTPIASPVDRESISVNARPSSIDGVGDDSGLNPSVLAEVVDTASQGNKEDILGSDRETIDWSSLEQRKEFRSSYNLSSEAAMSVVLSEKNHNAIEGLQHATHISDVEAENRNEVLKNHTANSPVITPKAAAGINKRDAIEQALPVQPTVAGH